MEQPMSDVTMQNLYTIRIQPARNSFEIVPVANEISVPLLRQKSSGIGGANDIYGIAKVYKRFSHLP